MLIKSANTVLNNFYGDKATIRVVHESTKRLYEAAVGLKKTEGQSNVAGLINVSPQTLANWEKRGMSIEGLLQAQRFIGCDAIWLQSGEGTMRPALMQQPSYDGVLRLISVFAALPGELQGDLLAYAETTHAEWIDHETRTNQAKRTK